MKLKAVHGFLAHIDDRPRRVVSVEAGDVVNDDDPVVAGHRDCFVELVEQATAAPGEKRGA